MEEAGGVLLGIDTVVAMRREKLGSNVIECSGNDIDDEFMEAGAEWATGKPTPANSVILRRLRWFLSQRTLAKGGENYSYVQK